MADQPTTTNVSATVSIADPISGDLQAVCGAVTALCQFLCSPAGQAALQQAARDTAAFETACSQVWSNFLALLKHS